MNATYTYDDRYTLNAVFNRSGSAYLPDGDKFANYPAISAAWIVSNEAFMEKITPIIKYMTKIYILLIVM